MILIGDLEANGLFPDVDTIWCGVFKDIETGIVYRCYDEWDKISDRRPFDLRLFWIPRLLDECDKIIMHNGIGYDRKLIKKVLGYEIQLEKIIDTLILSKLSKQDRPLPEGWKGKPAPHSVEAYGMRFGIPKPEHEDWSQFSEEMLFRCEKDVEIQEKIYNFLLNEMEG